MAMLSPVRAAVPLLDGLTLMHRGKVRDSYEIDEDKMLVVSTDGISIFDVVLNALVPEKGMILTAMSHFWFTLLAQHNIKTHFIATGANIDEFLPASLRGNTDLQSRAMVVERLEMHPVEFVARAYLTGSAFAEHRKIGTVCGYKPPNGLQDGDRLPRILDTTTTKAEVGHDIALDARAVLEEYGYETHMLLEIFKILSSFAGKRGILLADAKMEFGVHHDGHSILGDEVGTPDSSRFWDYALWLEGRKVTDNRKAPPSFDKQLVREWGIGCGINNSDPSLIDDAARVHGFIIPPDLIRATTHAYRYIFWRLFGVTIEDYLDRELGVNLPRKKKRVAIVFGSESDIKPVLDVLRLTDSDDFSGGFVEKPSVHVVSCHRNPIGLDAFVASGFNGADVVIAAGSKAFALPGVIDALFYSKCKEIPVVGVALGKKGTRAFEAAKLSIEELPGQPVIMDEVNGNVYEGREGLLAALQRVSFGELPPPKPRTRKPAIFNIDLSKF